MPDVLGQSNGGPGEQGAAQAGEAPAGTPASPGQAVRWWDTLPENLRGDGALTKFENIETLAKAYVEANSLIGRKRALPAEDAPQAEWDAYFTDIGRPESADQYELAPPADFPQEMYSADLEKTYRDLAHQAGLRPGQAKQIYDGFLQVQQGMIGQMLQMEKDNRAAAEQGLRTEWGAQYDARLADANFAVQAIGHRDAEVAASLAAKDPVWNHPALARFLANVGSMLRESGLVKGEAVNAGSLREEARKLMVSEAYTDKKHPEHQQVQARVTEIYGKLYPDKE